MLKVTLNDGRVFEIDLAASLTNVEAMAVERATGWDGAEIQERLDKGSALAFTALVWVHAKRQEPTLRFGDVEFDMSAVVRDEPPAELEAEAPDPSVPGSDPDPLAAHP
jgi:hypothetical protein